MKRSTFAALTLATLAGCVSTPPQQPPVAMTTQFSAEEHAAWKGEGTATINGQAFLRQNGGGVVTCAGQPVFLMPETPYFEELFSIMRRGRLPATAPGEGAKEIARQTMCDAQGDFVFTKVPAGPWLVTTAVSWTVGYQQQGGGLLKTIEVSDGEEAAVFLTDTDRVH